MDGIIHKSYKSFVIVKFSGLNKTFEIRAKLRRSFAPKEIELHVKLHLGPWKKLHPIL